MKYEAIVLWTCVAATVLSLLEAFKDYTALKVLGKNGLLKFVAVEHVRRETFRLASIALIAWYAIHPAMLLVGILTGLNSLFDLWARKRAMKMFDRNKGKTHGDSHPQTH